MKKAWRTISSYGSTFIVLFAENGKCLDFYKESTCKGDIAPRAFSFKEWSEEIPQKIKERLNGELIEIGEFTKFIERGNDNV